jgi:hypothetical protein
MRITKATLDDLDTLVAFRDQAAEWLASKGIDQWQEPWPTDDLMVEGMLRNIENGETFIIWDDDHTPAATITINHHAKPERWTEQSGPSRRSMPHKVTVDRAYGDQGLGPNCWTGPGPGRPTRVLTGCGWTCGQPTSTFSTTTCARASPTSAPLCYHTTPPGRCSNGQPSVYRHPAWRRLRA